MWNVEGLSSKGNRYGHGGSAHPGHQRCQWMVVVTMHLGGLARDAAPRPLKNIFCRPFQAKRSMIRRTEALVPGWARPCRISKIFGRRVIDMDMVEACIRDINGANGCFVVTMHLGGLARDAAPRPLANIFLQAISSKTFHD